MAYSSTLRSSMTDGAPRTRSEHLERSSMMSASLDRCGVGEKPPKTWEQSKGKGIHTRELRQRARHRAPRRYNYSMSLNITTFWSEY